MIVAGLAGVRGVWGEYTPQRDFSQPPRVVLGERVVASHGAKDERPGQQIDDVVDSDVGIDIAAVNAPVPEFGDGGAATVKPYDRFRSKKDDARSESKSQDARLYSGHATPGFVHLPLHMDNIVDT